MKIGKFSEISGISKDTIRYYIKLGLIIPEFYGGQMDFGEKEYESLKYIQRLKVMGFKIKEIQYIFHLKNLSNWIEPGIIAEYTHLLKNKLDDFNKEQESINKSIQLINEEISNYSSTEKVKKKLGISLKALEILACPNCNDFLKINNANISNNYIFSGDLECHCGYQAAISDGVVITNNKYTGDYDRPDLKRQLYRGLNHDFYLHFMSCSELILNRLKKISSKVVLEANVNGFSFLYNNFNKLKNDCLYIIIDKFSETIFMYKDLIEQLNLDLNILFIADASVNYPLKKNSIDLFINFFSENEFLLYHDNFFLKETLHLFTNDFLMLGSYSAFKENSKSKEILQKKYPYCSPNSYNFKGFKSYYSNLVNKEFSEKHIGVAYESPDQYSFSCHVKGEPLTTYFVELKNSPI